MIYVVELVDLNDGDYVTLNRGDIIAGFCADDPSFTVLRIVKNERDF